MAEMQSAPSVINIIALEMHQKSRSIPSLHYGVPVCVPVAMRLHVQLLSVHAPKPAVSPDNSLVTTSM